MAERGSEGKEGSGSGPTPPLPSDGSEEEEVSAGRRPARLWEPRGGLSSSPVTVSSLSVFPAERALRPRVLCQVREAPGAGDPAVLSPCPGGEVSRRRSSILRGAVGAEG